MNSSNYKNRRGFFKTIGILLLASGCKSLNPIPEECTWEIDTCGIEHPDQPFMVLYPPDYSGDPAPLCLYHGGMGEVCHAPVKDDLKVDLIQNILNAGYIVASSSAHGNNWGNAEALSDYIDLHKYVTHCHSITRTVLLSQSMGGCSGLLTVANRPFELSGWAGIYPVCNLHSIYSGKNESLRKSITLAYDLSENGGNYASKTLGHDPILRPPELYSGVRMRFYASDDDTVVEKKTNSDMMHDHVKGYALESEIVNCVGDHGDPSHFQSADLIAFLNRCQ